MKFVFRKIMKRYSSSKLHLIFIIITILLFVLISSRYSSRKSQSIIVIMEDLNSNMIVCSPETKLQNPNNIQEVHGIIKNSTGCYDKPLKPRINQRGKYWVLYNYATAKNQYGCAESITYTTHGDFTFLDNIEPLVEKWRGPISIALYAPGLDFVPTINSVAYLRECGSEMVKKFVTFHIYFESEYTPTSISETELFYNCSETPPYLSIKANETFKGTQQLFYPVNVGRNIARETAQTHFVFPSDIELYPSPDIIDRFLTMVANDTRLLSKGGNPRVYPLHLFEVESGSEMPVTKTKLKEMLNKGTAVPFHKYICPYCHSIPGADAWLSDDKTEGLRVFNVGKRTGGYANWEPIFIGTNDDPFYDERLTWDGLRDKMTQGYAMCVLDYDYLILDNAFLVHRPGIKYINRNPADEARKEKLKENTNALIDQFIYPELQIIYGTRSGCFV